MRRLQSADGARWYMVHGKPLPSVTTVLNVINKPALVGWSAKVEREALLLTLRELWPSMPADIDKAIKALTDQLGKTKAYQKQLSAAGDIGSQVHARIEWDDRIDLGLAVKEDLADLTGVAQRCYEHCCAWKKSVGWKPMLVEHVVFDEELGIAGTLDDFGLVNGAQSVVDWKSGRFHYPEHSIQLAIYRHCLIKMGLAKEPVDGWVVRLPKDEKEEKPDPKRVSWEEQESLMVAFRGAKAIFDWQQAAA